ncbi:MAG: LysR family transcriptional regulator [Steroidobacteraceae bacterium]
MNKPPHFDLNLLRVFDALWRHGHVGRASEELELSQPAVSHSLRKLRGQLGDPLFVKTRNGMQPSARAVQLAPMIQSILTNVRENVVAAPKFDPKSACRTFTIATSDIGEMVLLPWLLNRLKHEAPSVDIHMVSMPYRELNAALQKNDVDLAFGYFPDLDGSDIFQQQLSRQGFACLVRARHPVVRSKLTQAQFRELPHAIIYTEGRSHEIVEHYLRQHGIRRRESLRSRHLLSIPMVIESTDLIVTLPKYVGDIFARSANIRVLRPPYPLPQFDIKQYWHRCQHEDPGNRWLRAIVQKLLSQ